ncbi:RHS repeat-associated core domain-containing protein [Pseudomonas faucium]|uniref:RHS repeat-associated core domain-containing protein n=1 Tax=Pseudomonas faucium TaxID=2740518 RepID=UPI001F4030CB|nr:RHS repeat-associated core domain-containing protein [Pseudomonas faucium]
MKINAFSTSYTSYGYSQVFSEGALIHFAGAFRDLLTGHYPFGNGKRSYSPCLMRFLSPDSLSPFESGGINSYMYCAGDPENRLDRSGLSWFKRGEPAYPLQKIKSTDFHPMTRQYAGWHVNREANGWDAKMALKLPKRLDEKVKIGTKLSQARVKDKHNHVTHLQSRLAHVERKIELTRNRLTQLKAGLNQTEFSSILSQVPASDPPPDYVTSALDELVFFSQSVMHIRDPKNPNPPPYISPRLGRSAISASTINSLELPSMFLPGP